MERKSGFLTFIAALIPGVGYMYYGLMKKGVEALIIYVLISPIFDMVGMHSIGSLIKIPLWIYLFFDTFNIASKYRRGEVLQDSGFIFKDDAPITVDAINSINDKLPKNKWNILAVFLIIVGAIAILNQFIDENMFYFVRAAIRNYFVPIIFIVLGIYLLIKSNKKSL